MSRDLTNIKEKFNKLFIHTGGEIQTGHSESAFDKGAHRKGKEHLEQAALSTRYERTEKNVDLWDLFQGCTYKKGQKA